MHLVVTQKMKEFC